MQTLEDVIHSIQKITLCLERWWNYPHSRTFNLARVGLMTGIMATTFFFTSVGLWLLTAFISLWYAFSNLIRSRDRLNELRKLPAESVLPIHMFWAERRLRQEAVIAMAALVAVGVGVWAVLFVRPILPMTVTFINLILPGALTLIHLLLTTYSWMVHHDYHAGIQLIQADKLRRQMTER